MAKFIKTPNLWDLETAQAIESGELVLQVGQWVKCGSDGVVSRFVSFRNGVYNVIHQNNRQNFMKRFKFIALCERANRENWTIEKRRESIKLIRDLIQ